MNPLSWLFARSEGGYGHQDILIDLAEYTCGDSRLGEPVNVSDYFAEVLRKRDVFKDEANGLEVGTAEGVLDYVFVEMERFRGRFVKSGSLLDIGMNTREGDVMAVFGEPYWTDRSDGEVIIFYEYRGGSVELQFEFPTSVSLGFITLLRKGALFEEKDRASYGVTKAWPPMSASGDGR